MLMERLIAFMRNDWQEKHICFYSWFVQFLPEANVFGGAFEYYYLVAHKICKAALV